MFLLHVKSYVVGQTSSQWCGVEVRRGGVPPQVWSSSSDCGLKFRGLSQNRPSVASKRNRGVSSNSAAVEDWWRSFCFETGGFDITLRQRSAVYLGLVQVISVGVKCSPADVSWKFGEWVSAQVSSSDQDSK
ncbi:hypothetical protein AVEN_274150-1 [Araneus ventricosus]|uniref:Uncharacterized protein n=1 Tax=Araneus ventricosus TaxID=182803 RepID=A0A4Y2FZA3_ARAVE|nr:hypothetical protein AVEN_274150-1 [Araneus ventricosus]